MLRRVLIALMFVVLGLPSMALADQIAQVNEALGQGNAYILTDNGTYETFTVTNLPVTFSFASGLNIGIPQNTSATLNLYASTSTTATGTSQLDEGGFSGSFSIISSLYGNLLSGSFGPIGDLSGRGSGMTFSDSTPPPSEVAFTSQYLDFVKYSGTLALSFALSNVTPALSINVADHFLASTTGSGVDTFSATPVPPVVAAEPETLVLSGVLLLGIARLLRKRKLQSAL